MPGLSRRNLTRLNKAVSLVHALPRGRLIAGASNGHYWPRLVRGLFVHAHVKNGISARANWMMRNCLAEV
jgi:hypothetical protein